MTKLSEHPWMVRLIIAGLFTLTITVSVSAATLVIDGQFNDWAGQPHVDDPNDGGNPNIDVFTFYWGNNPNDEYIYWMIERQNSNAKVYYFVYLDTNNDGDYTDAQDRLLQAYYNPKNNTGEVTVTVFGGTGSQISQNSGNWGESKSQGGSRAEWRASLSDLGIDTHQTVNMYAGASQNQNQSNLDRVPDSGDITWSPIPALGWPWLTAIIIVVIIVAWQTRGRFKWRQTSSSLF